MTRLPLPRLRGFPIALFLIAGSFCGSATAFAQATPASPTTESPPTANADPIRLTDQQRMAILDGTTEAGGAAARGEKTALGNFLSDIHGEVGIMAGTHGTRGAYGVADIPLGDNGGATVSFESSRFGYRR